MGSDGRKLKYEKQGEGIKASSRTEALGLPELCLVR